MMTAAVAPPSYLNTLNPAQRMAVEAIDGPLLVLAGAGTGKTKVLTTRLAHILSTRKAWPSQILAVTFTNKAALEMKKRVAATLGQDTVEGWWLGTFHALAARMLRQHADRVGLNRNFSILDDDDQLRVIKQVAEGLHVDLKATPPRVLLALIQRWKDRAQGPHHIGAPDGTAAAQAARVYGPYQDRLKSLNACDFGDLLLHVVTLFRTTPEVLAEWQGRFRYILVDEYQDTNAAQYQWLRLLTQTNKNICCVGDDDQSIYGWRGADVGNILRFENDFPGAKLIRLEQNYRSTQNILSVANALIARNQGRLGKTLWSADTSGEKVSVRGVWDGGREAQAVVDDVIRLQNKGMHLREMAVLVRAGHQTREFEDRMMRHNIPYRVVGGLRFYERQEIRDAIAYLRVVAQPQDDLAFERIVNLPKRGLGDSTLDLVRQTARGNAWPFTQAAKHVCSGTGLKPKPRTSLQGLLDQFERWRLSLQDKSHVAVAQQILDESGYLAMWRADLAPEAAGRLENLKEFISSLAEFETLELFLEHVSLVMERQDRDGDDTVSIMTLHAAKGLEFDTVFLPGWEEGIFPSQRSLEEGGLTSLEEERRLAYVGLTRARHQAFILFAAHRMIYGQYTNTLPSRFIEELPTDLVKVTTESGLYVTSQQNSAVPKIDIPSWDLGLDKTSDSGFKTGDSVRHASFGMGVILNVDDNRLEIRFDRVGRKTLIDRFVEKT